MNLEIKNFAKIKYADIKINGLTIIAGENNTGKSTIGKLLFVLYRIFNNMDEQIVRERKKSISKALSNSNKIMNLIFKSNSYEDDSDIEVDEYFNLINLLLVTSDDNIVESVRKAGYDISDDSFAEIYAAKNYSTEKIIELIVKEHLREEFKDQYLPFGGKEDTLVDLTVKNKHNILKSKDNQHIQIINEINLEKECFLIDNPFVIDNSTKEKVYSEFYERFYTIYNGFYDRTDHKEHLISKLRESLIRETNNSLISEAILSERLDSFKKRIIDVIHGDFVEKKDKFVFLDYQTNKELEISNLSTGIKSFAILLKLIENRDITDKSMIVLDEPEIHLHPKWQVEFAKLLILLQKEFDLNVVLTTHSPYFIQAIEVFSMKYDIVERCNYYLAELNDNFSVIKDVTSDIDKIYKKLATPLLELSEEESRLVEYDD